MIGLKNFGELFMRQGSRLVILFLVVVSFLMLSGCSFFAPGMQMDTSGLTPTVNAQNKIVRPTIIPITAKLIQRQQQNRDAAKHFAARHYVAPRGFTTKTRSYVYRVAPQDVLQIVVWNQAGVSTAASNVSQPASLDISSDQGAAQTSNEFIVSTHGNIFYPYLGNVRVAGKTTSQIRQLLSQKMAHYFKNPQITVNVLKYNSQRISVTGAVKQPTTLPITNVPLNVLTAVTQAGGPIRCGVVTSGNVNQTCADLHDVSVKRGQRIVHVDLNRLTAINGSSNNWILKDGDVVYVPNNNESRIFVLGQVNAPGAYNMIDGAMTLREAVGNARGMSQGSNPAYTYIIRNYLHQPSIFTLNLRSPDALNLAGDFSLKPGDIVFVSTSALHDFNTVLSQFTPTLLTAVSIKSLTHWR